MSVFFKWHFILCRWYRKLGHKRISRLDGSLLITAFVGVLIVNILFVKGILVEPRKLFEGEFPKLELLIGFLVFSFVIDAFVYLKGKEYLKVAQQYRNSSLEERKSDSFKVTFFMALNMVTLFLILAYLIFTA